jgi:hypothetical protein
VLDELLYQIRRIQEVQPTVEKIVVVVPTGKTGEFTSGLRALAGPAAPSQAFTGVPIEVQESALIPQDQAFAFADQVIVLTEPILTEPILTEPILPINTPGRPFITNTVTS